MNDIENRCKKMWNGMRQRCNHCQQYENIEIRMTRTRFNAWAHHNIKNFLFFDPDGTPSIDRIDPDGHYELGNIRIISVEENRIKSRFICSYLKLNKMETNDKIETFCKNIVSTCNNAGIDKNELIWFLRNQI